jgi:hypothetical protein
VCSNVDVWDRVIEGNSQNAYAEHHDDVYLLLHAQRETQQLWYRNSQDGNIEDDIDSSMRPGEDMKVDAFSGMLTVPARPDVGYWQAVEEASDCERGAICKADRQEYVYSPPELFARKDAQTKAEERHFRECYRHEVEDFGKPCELLLVSRCSLGSDHHST